MAELIVFPDVEDLLRRHFAERIPPRISGVQAFAATLPATLPAKSVLVRRTGGPADSLVIDRAQITCESRAKTPGAAHELAQLVRALIGAAEREGVIGDVPVYDVREFSGPYLDPDPLNPTHARYSATYQVAVRGTAA
jgi:hypothetical protein